MKKKALCIVAHPDDETIWMGGTILQNKNWDWTIFSLCRSSDSDRAPKFKKVCALYNANSIISDLDDESDKPVSFSEIRKIIMDNLEGERFDFIFTHGEDGEYGHRRHKEIHRAVRNLKKSNKLKCEKLFFFDYLSGSERSPHDNETVIPIPNEKADVLTQLTDKQYNQKLKIITDIYKYSHPILETMACAKQEAFAT